MRPNFFTNTPDINPYFNHNSGRPGFRTRVVMAGSLSGNWGMYSGFEFCEADWLPPKDEYLHSEKYETQAPRPRRAGQHQGRRAADQPHPPREPGDARLPEPELLTAHDDRVLYYGRFDEAARNYLLFHVLIDPFAGAEFDFELPLWELGLPDEASVEVRGRDPRQPLHLARQAPPAGAGSA